MDYATMDRQALARAYVEQIGYDPFEDDPTISIETVRETLRERDRSAALVAFGAADDAWQAELEVVFGWWGAGDARYAACGRGEEGSRLRAAYLARDAARVALEHVMREGR